MNRVLILVVSLDLLLWALIVAPLVWAGVI
jgi:hypothetical protein